jgi:iron complex outermembrane receptor protein
MVGLGTVLSRVRAAGALCGAVCGLAAFTTTLSASPPQSGQPSAPRLAELTLAQLGEIEITSVSKQPEDVWRTAVAIHVITADDIRRSGALTIPEAVRLAPGIAVARIDSDHWSIGVRGFGDQFSKSLLVLIDGRSIYTPLFAGMYWPAHDTMMEDVERIEVIRGPGGTIWGGNAVNGVINIITKRAADTHGALASLGSGTVDRGAMAFRYGGGNDRGFDYRVYGKGFTFGRQFHEDGGNYDDWWMGQTGFKAEWAAQSRDRLTLQGEVSRGSHGQRVAISSFSPAATLAVDTPFDVSGVNLLARWERALGAGNDLSLQTYYDRTSWSASHFEEDRSTVDVDLMHGFRIGARHRLLWGVGARWSPSTFSQVIPTLDFDPRSETGTLFSAFGQDEIQIVPKRVVLTAGAKFEHNNYTGLETQPSVRLAWTPRETQAIWTAVTRAVRTPSRLERDMRLTSFVPANLPIPVFLQVTGSSSFTSEQMIGYEAGYRTRLVPNTYLDLAVFHHDHDDLASFGLGATTVESLPAPVHAVIRFPYVNGIKGSTDGFEVAPDWRPAAWWQLKGSYSYLRLDLRSKPGNVDTNAVTQYEGSSPHHQALVQSRLNFPAGVELDATYRYVSELPGRQVQGYHTADLRAGWQVTAATRFSVSGQNLLAPHHVEFSHAPPPSVAIRRSVYAALTWTPPRGRRP